MPKAKPAKSRRPDKATAAAPARAGFDPLAGWRWIACLGLLVLIFYWTPLTDSQTTPQWDAIDVHYSSQKYFADHVWQGEMPYWTPYIFSGFPFLADPQVGAWYPLNWPFFLAGITPKALEAELAIHALLAGAGAYLFLLLLVESKPAAFTGALFYAFSGFLADHSQHIGMFSTVSWLPWLLWFFHRALDGSLWKWTAAAGLAGGAMILAGHFQAALYAFCAVGLYAIAQAIGRRERAWRIAGFLAGFALLAVLFSAIQTLPGLELTRYSGRATSDFGASTERILHLRALLNLIWPNATGLFSVAAGVPQPADIAYYLYSGVLLLPLAVAGLKNARVRFAGLALTLIPIWYMLGPAWGLYRLGDFIPGLHRVRAPIHGWFVATLGLTMLAAAGAAWLFEKTRQQSAVKLALVAFVFLDLFYWNSATNPEAYARFSFEQGYGSGADLARQKVIPSLAPHTRFHAPDRLTVFGPLNHPLDLAMESTYGYNPLQITFYTRFLQAAASNPKLYGGLNVSQILDAKIGGVVPYEGVLPRAYFARAIESAANDRESSARLATLDPAAVTLLNTNAPLLETDPNATVNITAITEQEYRMHYRAARPSLLRISVPYFPGWSAAIDGAPYPILRVDHAFIGVVVPAGEKDLRLFYRSSYFFAGACLSALALVAGLALLRLGAARDSPRR